MNIRILLLLFTVGVSSSFITVRTCQKHCKWKYYSTFNDSTKLLKCFETCIPKLQNFSITTKLFNETTTFLYFDIYKYWIIKILFFIIFFCTYFYIFSYICYSTFRK